MITLASKRYTIVPYSNTLDSRYANGIAPATILAFETFDTYTLPGDLGLASTAGGAVSIETVGSYSGKAVKGVYPAGSDSNSHVYGKFDIEASEAYSIYLRFRAKMPSAFKHGCKFIKIFGANLGGDANNYANVTFGLDYTGEELGGMYCVSFGDGTGIGNDTSKIIRFDGTSTGSELGRNSGIATISTPQNATWPATNWGTDWHLFELAVKFNSGTTAENETNDGEFFVAIDGVTYVDATGLYNRHYSNLPVKWVALYNTTQGVRSDPFELWYDNIEIATGGWGDGSV